LSKCIKLQVSNVFSIKLSNFFIKNIKDVYVLEKYSKMNFLFFHWTKYEKDNNGLKKEKIFKTSLILKCTKSQDSNEFAFRFYLFIYL
jgi:hypothetical protein